MKTGQDLAVSRRGLTDLPGVGEQFIPYDAIPDALRPVHMFFCTQPGAVETLAGISAEDLFPHELSGYSD
ncbi:MAG: hypothetical protein WCI89_02460 [bacterium]